MAHPPSEGGRKSNISGSTKIALGIIVIVGIAAFIFYDPAGLSFGLKGDELTNIFGNKIGGHVNFTMTSSESLLKEGIVLKDATILLNGVHSADTVIGDSVVDDKGKDSDIGFDEFNGRLDLVGGAISIDGTAANADVEGAKLKPKNKKFSVSSELKPDSYAIDPVTIDRISLLRVFGSIARIGEESSTTNLANSTVEITDFQGSISFDGKAYTLSGSATEIRGKSFTLKGN